MTAPKREYARIYHDLVDDPDMTAIYADDRAFSTWVKLLMIADQAWPSSGMLPAGLSRQGLSVCVDHGAVIVDGHRFRMRGMDKERTGRSERARRAANALHGGSGRYSGDDDDGMQTQPSSTANGEQTHPSGTAERVPSQAEQSRAEQSQAKQSTPGVRVRGSELDGIDLFRDGLPHLDEPTLRLGHEITGKPAREAGDRQLDELDRLLGEYGPERVQSAMRRIPSYEGKVTWQRLVWGARKVLEPLWEGGKPETPAQREEREMRDRQSKLNAEAAARRAPQGVA